MRLSVFRFVRIPVIPIPGHFSYSNFNFCFRNIWLILYLLRFQLLHGFSSVLAAFTSPLQVRSVRREKVSQSQCFLIINRICAISAPFCVWVLEYFHFIRCQLLHSVTVTTTSTGLQNLPQEPGIWYSVWEFLSFLIKTQRVLNIK